MVSKQDYLCVNKTLDKDDKIVLVEAHSAFEITNVLARELRQGHVNVRHPVVMKYGYSLKYSQKLTHKERDQIIRSIGLERLSKGKALGIDGLPDEVCNFKAGR